MIRKEKRSRIAESSQAEGEHVGRNYTLYLLTNTHFTNMHVERANQLVDTVHKVQTKKWEQDVKLDNASPLCWKQISWPNKYFAIWPDSLRMTPLGYVCHSSFVLGLTWSAGATGKSCMSTYMVYYRYFYCGTEGLQIKGLYISAGLFVCCSS